MKTSPMLFCFAAISALAQDLALPIEPVPPVPPAPAVTPVPPIPPLSDFVALPAIRGIAQAVEMSAATALAQAREAVERTKAAARAHADFALQIGKDPHGILFRSAKPGRTLVIPGKEINASTANTLEEDLNVMARILEKAIERKSEDDGPKAMGIEVFSSGSSSGVRNLYLDGYGAVFILKVRFPLTPPPEKADQTKTNEPASSEWTETWQDLYGSKGGWESDLNRGFYKEWSPKGAGPSEGYDADKVEKLKAALLEALKNATNIRNLRSDEKVTVAVTSSAGSMDVKKKRLTTESRGGGRGGGSYTVETHEGSAQSVLTIHAKKSDIDSFAKGKLTLEEFRKKIALTLY